MEASNRSSNIWLQSAGHSFRERAAPRGEDCRAARARGSRPAVRKTIPGTRPSRRQVELAFLRIHPAAPVAAAENGRSALPDSKIGIRQTSGQFRNALRAIRPVPAQAAWKIKA